MKSNLFLIEGQPAQGKTSISKQFSKYIECSVLHTDDYYHNWIKEHYPSHSKLARRSIKSHFPKLSKERQQEWNDYISNEIELHLRDNACVVAEGWLLLHLPHETIRRWDEAYNLAIIHMRRFCARYGGYDYCGERRDYSVAIKGLLAHISVNEKSLDTC